MVCAIQGASKANNTYVSVSSDYESIISKEKKPVAKDIEDSHLYHDLKKQS